MQSANVCLNLSVSVWGALIHVYGVTHGPYKASTNSISPLLTLRLVELLPALEDLMTTLAIMTKHPTSTSRIR